jgi:hypothetical protein
MICRNVVDHQEFQKLCKMIINKKNREKETRITLTNIFKTFQKLINHLVLILNKLVIILNKLDAKLIPFSGLLNNVNYGHNSL